MIILIVIALAVWVRVAPSDPAAWNIALADQSTAVSGPCADQILVQPNGAKATCLLQDDPATVLAKLNAIALATPRTTLFAGPPTDGLMTWITRSRLFGFPDYTTAEVHKMSQGASRLDIFARQRFGKNDRGVNAARLTAWLGAL